MAASTITRTTWTNDTGIPAAPVGDGTILNNARLQDIYSAIDQMFSGAGSYASLTLGGLFSVEGFGTSKFEASGTGNQLLVVRNVAAGATNSAEVSIGNDISLSAGRIIHTSSTYTPSAPFQADSFNVMSTRPGGMGVGTISAHTLRLYTASTERLTISGAGVFAFASGSSVTSVPIADGSAASPSLVFASDLNTGLFRAAEDRLNIAAGGVEMASFENGSTDSKRFIMKHHANLGAAPPAVEIQRNTAGAGGALGLQSRNGTAYWLYVSDDGKLRIYANAFPARTIDSDTVGTVVGTQS